MTTLVPPRAVFAFLLTAKEIGARRREIGIRAALGAPPRQLLRAVFFRAACS